MQTVTQRKEESIIIKIDLKVYLLIIPQQSWEEEVDFKVKSITGDRDISNDKKVQKDITVLKFYAANNIGLKYKYKKKISKI